MILFKNEFGNHLLAGDFRCSKCELNHVFKRVRKTFHQEFKVPFYLESFILNFFDCRVFEAHHVHAFG